MLNEREELQSLNGNLGFYYRYRGIFAEYPVDASKIFKRPFQALAKKNDVLIVISTSGNSSNIIEVLKYARSKKITTVGFLGGSGGKCKKFCDIKLIVPNKSTARIQECHIFLGHFILEQVENILINK